MYIHSAKYITSPFGVVLFSVFLAGNIVYISFLFGGRYRGDNNLYMNIWFQFMHCVTVSFMDTCYFLIFLCVCNFDQNPLDVLFNVSAVSVLILLYVTIVTICYHVHKNVLCCVCGDTFSFSFTYCHVNQTTSLYCQSTIHIAEFAGKITFIYIFHMGCNLAQLELP